MKQILVFAAILLAVPVYAQPVPATEIRAALVETADAIDSVLLDEQGRARGDYDWQSGSWREYEVAWHTGQAIEGLLWAHETTGNSRYLQRARQAGDYWISLELKDGPFKGMIDAAHGDRLGKLINFTTVGNGTPGLFHLSRVTGDRRYADVATKAIGWLARNTKVPGHEGLYYNILDPDTGTIWTDKSPHHDVAKASVNQVSRPNIEGSPFLDACKHSGQKWLCKAHNTLALATAKQQADGLWIDFEPNNPETGTVHPRFNSWNAEAMLRTWRETRQPLYREAALATARANAWMMKSDGAFDYVQNRNGKSGNTSPTGSATAFAGILWLELRTDGYRDFDPQIHAAARWLIANRYTASHPDPNLRGLVIERRIKGGSIVQRDLGNLFAARFLAMYLKAFP